MDTFFKVKNPEGTYHVECVIYIYRETFKCHPKFITDKINVGDDATGYYTSFFILVDDDLTEVAANKKVKELSKKYNALVEKCENTGDWEDFPFKDNVIVYCK